MRWKNHRSAKKWLIRSRATHHTFFITKQCLCVQRKKNWATIRVHTSSYWSIHLFWPSISNQKQIWSFSSRKDFQWICFELRVSEITPAPTTPSHPQGNWQCERFNSAILNMFKTLPENQKSNWAQYMKSLLLHTSILSIKPLDFHHFSHCLVATVSCQSITFLILLTLKTNRLIVKWLQRDANPQPLSSQTNTQPFSQKPKTIQATIECGFTLKRYVTW